MCVGVWGGGGYRGSHVECIIGRCCGGGVSDTVSVCVWGGDYRGSHVECIIGRCCGGGVSDTVSVCVGGGGTTDVLM